MVRSANWNDTKLSALVDRVSKYRVEVESKFVHHMSARSTTWAAVTKMVNGVGMAGRTSYQIEKKWANHKSRMLTAIQKYRNDMCKTGKIK